MRPDLYALASLVLPRSTARQRSAIVDRLLSGACLNHSIAAVANVPARGGCGGMTDPCWRGERMAVCRKEAA